MECPSVGVRTESTLEDSEGTAVERERPKRPKKPTYKWHGRAKRPKGILTDDFDDSSDFVFAKVSADAFNQCRGIS